MKTVTASIFVELEIKVSGTHVKGCPESHNPPSPAEPAGWEDITIQAISHEALRLKDGKLERAPFDLFTVENAYRPSCIQIRGYTPLDYFLKNIADEFSEEIEQALSDELPDGPDPDHARDAAIDRDLMGYDR